MLVAMVGSARAGGLGDCRHRGISASVLDRRRGRRPEVSERGGNLTARLVLTDDCWRDEVGREFHDRGR